MKNHKLLLCILMTALLLAGCGKEEKSVQTLPEPTVESTVEPTAEPTSAPTTEPTAAPTAEPVAERPIDVDLTKMSSTMVYSEVYNMMMTPEDYIGQKVRMNGQFAIYQETDENGIPLPDQIYFACVIADATACCQQGLEFVLTGNKTYPDDYPELGTDVTVTGIFDTYMEGDYRYCHLVDAVMG